VHSPGGAASAVFDFLVALPHRHHKTILRYNNAFFAKISDGEISLICLNAVTSISYH